MRERQAPGWFRTFIKSVAILAIVAALAGSFAPAAWAQEADLTVGKSGPETAAAGANVAYSITVTNLGPDAALTAELTDPIPAGMTFVSLTQNNGPAFVCSDPGVGNGGTVTCTNATLAAAASANFTLVLNIPTGAAPGTFFTNIASATTATFDPNDENNSGVATTLVSGGTSADVGISKSAPEAAVPGSNIVYSLVASNAGPDAAASAVMADTLPGNLAFVSLTAPAGWACTTPAVGSGGTINCTIASFAAGGSGTFTLTAHVPPSTPSGTLYTNTATISSSTSDTNSENDSATANTTVSSADVGIVKSGPASVVRGQNITYTLTISNAGPDVATNAVLVDSLPADLTFQSLVQDTGPAATCATPASGSGGTISCSFSILGSGASAQFTLVVNSTDAAAPSRTNTATASSESADSDTSNNSSSVTTTVTAGPTATSLIASPNPSVVGQTVTFTATITPATATGTVTFTIDGAAQPPVTVSGGQATLITSTLSVGSHTIVANYSGGGVFSPSSSPAVTQTVNKGATTTSVSATPNPAKPGQEIELTATVAVTAPATGTPTGTVTFKEGATTLGTATLASGKASFTTSELAIGKHMVTASYAGSSDFEASTGTVMLTVDPRVGPEFRVNTFTAGTQHEPSVARLSNDGFVVAWASNQQDGSGYGIYAQRYRADGKRSGGEFHVSTRAVAGQSRPSVAGLTNGFVVLWQSANQDGSVLGIYGQRYNLTGKKAGNEFRVNTTTALGQLLPSAAGLSGGGFIAVWASRNQDGSLTGIYGQRYKADGTAAGSEFRVNSTTKNRQTLPSVAGLSGGGFIVAWQSETQDGSGFGIYAQRFTAGGGKVGGEFRVNTAKVKDQLQPSVTAGLSDGGFVIAWQSDRQDGAGFGIYAQRYAKTGAKIGGEFRVNTTTAMNQARPSVAAFQDGGFVVAWSSRDKTDRGIFAQVYDAKGQRVDTELPVNTTTMGTQSQPSAAAFSDGNFVIVWTSQNQDGSLEGVYGQRFRFGGL